MKLTVDDILAEWKGDAKFDETKLGLELSKTPLLHSKYLEIYMQVKGRMIAAETKYNKLKFLRKKYYRGEMTLQELQTYGWDQYQGLKMSQSEFNSMAEIDPELVDEFAKVEYWKTLVQGVEYIMKQINQRDWSLKTLLEHNKMMLGGG